MKVRRGHWIPVVTGFIKRNGQVLLGQRPDGQSLAGSWEFPGGKIELGESPEDALARELREELGIEAEVGTLKMAASHQYGETGILILFYDVSYWKGEVKPVHHMELRWVYPSELHELPLPEANRKLLPKIIEILKEV